MCGVVFDLDGAGDRDEIDTLKAMYKMYILYMATEMSMSQARPALPEITNRAEYLGETTYLTRNGRRTAAVVSAERAELLEDLETLIDHQAVQEALDALAAGTETMVPFRRRTRRTDAE